jgi:hypothetical protein
MSPPEFEPAMPASDRTQILALDRSATGIGYYVNHPLENYINHYYVQIMSLYIEVWILLSKTNLTLKHQ